ncbi:MAG: GAF domain-containing protein [Vulcanimicrobiota bacterium]
MDLKEYKVILAETAQEEDIRRALKLALRELPAERGCLLLNLDQTEVFLYVGDESLRDKYPFSREVVCHVLQDGLGLVDFSARGGGELPESVSIKALGLRSALCVPILHLGSTAGFLYFDTRAKMDAFEPEHVDFARDLAQEIYERVMKR